MREPYDLSFVVPVRNAAAYLPRCLGSIAAAAAPGRHEVIVVDNGSTDDSASLASKAGARVLSLPGARVGAVRNAGARVASGRAFAFVDADNEIDCGWGLACAAALSDASVGAAGLPYQAPSPSTWVQHLYDLLRFRPRARQDVRWLGAGNLVVRREVFEAVGGFDEALEACEDVALCLEIERAGYRIVAEPGMRSVHHGDPATLSALFAGELWRGRDNLRVSLRGPWWSLPSVLVPVASLALVVTFCATLLAAPWLGWSLPVLAISGLVGIALLRTAVIIRRGRLTPPTLWVQSLAVALTFELGRAFALLGVASHRTRTRATPA